jgi:hypothetical protein
MMQKIYKFNLFNFLNTEARRGYTKSVPGTFVAVFGVKVNHFQKYTILVYYWKRYVK